MSSAKGLLAVTWHGNISSGVFVYKGRMFARTIIALAGCVAILSRSGVNARADEFDSAGVKIHYIVKGQGEPVILIHGLYSSAAMNWGLPGITAELARHNQVIALDNRGHGQSDKPEAEGQYGVKMIDDVVRLMDHLHIARAHVVGYSMGGMIAMKLVTLHPDRVSSVVLGGMGWLKENGPAPRMWEAIKQSDQAKVPMACPHGFSELAVSEQAVKSVRVPVEIIVGDHDPCRHLYVGPLHQLRPDWPVHLIEDAGHLNCVLKPEFKQQLKAAVDSQAGSGSK